MAPSFKLGEYHLSPGRVLLKCRSCGWREPAEEAVAGIDEERWYQEAFMGFVNEPPPAYRCRSCGRLRYVDESIEIETWDLAGLPVEPVKVA